MGTYEKSHHGQRFPRGGTGAGNAWSVRHSRGHSAGGPHPGVLLVEDSPRTALSFENYLNKDYTSTICRIQFLFINKDWYIYDIFIDGYDYPLWTVAWDDVIPSTCWIVRIKKKNRHLDAIRYPLFLQICQFAFDANATLACVRGDAIQQIVLVKPSTLLNKVLKKKILVSRLSKNKWYKICVNISSWRTGFQVT